MMQIGQSARAPEGKPAATERVLALLRQGVSQTKIAEQIGVTQATVSHIKTRNSEYLRGDTVQNIAVPAEPLPRDDCYLRKYDFAVLEFIKENAIRRGGYGMMQMAELNSARQLRDIKVNDSVIRLSRASPHETGGVLIGTNGVWCTIKTS